LWRSAEVCPVGAVEFKEACLAAAIGVVNVHAGGIAEVKVAAAQEFTHGDEVDAFPGGVAGEDVDLIRCESGALGNLVICHRWATSGTGQEAHEDGTVAVGDLPKGMVGGLQNSVG